MTTPTEKAAHDLDALNLEIVRLRQALEYSETQDREQTLTRLYALEKDAAALRHALQTDPQHKQPTPFKENLNYV